LNIDKIIKELRSIAQECKTAARDCQDEELADYLQEITIILRSIASVLEEYNQ
jgi:hypothetical protein